MTRIQASADVFVAVAEPQRRRILDLLSAGELPVNDIVKYLHISQPLASKHLRILRTVDLVTVRNLAQQRFYRLNAARLKPIHQWLGSFEQFWEESFDRLDVYLQDLQRRESNDRVP